jgi:hypothetical protein
MSAATQGAAIGVRILRTGLSAWRLIAQDTHMPRLRAAQVREFITTWRQELEQTHRLAPAERLLCASFACYYR